MPLALWPYSQSWPWLQNHRFTQYFVRIVRAGETLVVDVPVPALSSIPACLIYSQEEDCDTSASPSVLSVVPGADAVEPFPLPAAMDQAQTWLLATSASVCLQDQCPLPVQFVLWRASGTANPPSVPTGPARSKIPLVLCLTFSAGRLQMCLRFSYV